MTVAIKFRKKGFKGETMTEESLTEQFAREERHKRETAEARRCHALLQAAMTYKAAVGGHASVDGAIDVAQRMLVEIERRERGGDEHGRDEG